MKQKIGLAILGLRISAIIYYLIIVGCIVGGCWLFSDSNGEIYPVGCWCLAIFTLPFVIFVEIVILNLKRRRFWAWVAGIVIGGLYVLSLFLPLGVLILVGLLVEESRLAFGVGTTHAPEPFSAEKIASCTASEN